MKSTKNSSKLLIACIALISVVALLKADYYKPDFFPIGLTGLNYTGVDPDGLNCPYGHVVDQYEQRIWYWNSGTNNEKALIDSLGVNCIGSEDLYPTYIMNFGSSENNYLHKICKARCNDEDTTNDIYVIPASYWVDTAFVREFLAPCCNMDTYTVEVLVNPSQYRASNFFRSPHRSLYGGWGDPLFAAYNDDWDDPEVCNDSNTTNTGWGCHGSRYDNWEYEGDTNWQKTVNNAIDEFENYFDTKSTQELNCIWGWNLITEDPAVVRNYSELGNEWHGCWAAVNNVFDGFRAAENGTNHMIVAKSGIVSLVRADINIFETLKDLDAIVSYWEAWCHALYNYGDQELFDSYLYGDNHTYGNDIGGPEWKRGYHNLAIYFQKYGNTPGNISGQKRRWIAAPGLQWRLFVRDSVGLDSTQASCRRPCPPEIRCATYLAFSRGAKGILYHCWSFYTTVEYYYGGDTITVTCPYPAVEIPFEYTSTWDHLYYYNVGIRDQLGYPFGDSSSDDYQNHWLNDGPKTSSDSTYWHGPGRRDHTYYYLDTLIQEIKLLAPTLMQLDWVNGYSLNSTDPNWTSPCPHDYVMEVAGVSYMDLGLFDHPYEPVGVEYFMLVNREGIADMTNRTVTVALDAGHWPEEDTLILTDIANLDRPRRLSREGDRFTFTEVFEPGEGKLYRAAPKNEAPVTFLNR